MGLDLTAYRKIEFVAAWPDNDEAIDDFAEYDGEQRGYVWNGRVVTSVYSHRDFTEHALTLPPGLYTYAEQVGWRAGSYSGYGEWRAWLCRARFGVTPEHVWKNFDRYRDHGVAWLINFSDAEGYIDAATCARILADLRENEAMIRDKALGPDASWRVDRLDAWLIGLEMAADGGMLSFH